MSSRLTQFKFGIVLDPFNSISDIIAENDDIFDWFENNIDTKFELTEQDHCGAEGFVLVFDSADYPKEEDVQDLFNQIKAYE